VKDNGAGFAMTYYDKQQALDEELTPLVADLLGGQPTRCDARSALRKRSTSQLPQTG
jgi:hypothetical protein